MGFRSYKVPPFRKVVKAEPVKFQVCACHNEDTLLDGWILTLECGHESGFQPFQKDHPNPLLSIEEDYCFECMRKPIAILLKRVA